MSVAAQSRGSTDRTEVLLTYEFALEPQLALAWVTELIVRPLVEITPSGYVFLLGCYRDLAAACPGSTAERPPAQLPARGRALLQSAIREATQRNRDWIEISGAASFVSRIKTAWDRLPDEIWQALTASSNLPGTISQILLLLDALYQSLPLTWVVKVQGGTWELYDANALARKHAFGKAAKRALKPRMSIRARGVRMPWLMPGARTANGAVRMAAPGARTVAEGVRIARAGVMKWVPKTAWSSLPGRGVLSGNAIGMALTLVPQAIADASDSGLLDKPTDTEAWNKFAIAEAKGQSGNLFGVVGGMVAGAVIVAAGVTCAPAVIIVSLAGGALAQAGFNALGLNDEAGKLAEWLLGR